MRTTSMHPQGEFVADLIEASLRAHARGALGLQFPGASPAPLLGRASALDDWLRDTEVRLTYLANALACGCPELFVMHVSWVRSAFESAGIDVAFLRENLVALRGELSATLPAECVELVAACIQSAQDSLAAATSGEDQQAREDPPWTELQQRFLLAVLEARGNDAIGLITDAYARGASVAELHAKVLATAQTEIGGMWHRGEIHIAEEHLASNVVCDALVLLRSKAAPARASRKGKLVLLASVPGNLHDLGARMVSDQLDLDGFQVAFLGANTPARDLALAARDLHPDLIALSVQLGSQVRGVAALIELLRRELGAEAAPILIGGGPFAALPELWRAVGADASAPDAPGAVLQARRLTAAR